MARRNPVCWLMTDERMGEELWRSLRRLPPGAGVVFRHHATPAATRRRLLRRVERIAAARRLTLIVAGGGSGKAGRHGLSGARVGTVHSAPAHDRREAIRAIRAGARVLFVSPVYATRSHPGAPAIGPVAAARVARGLGATTIALGGVDRRRWQRIRRWGFDGWGAIDAWLDQKRKTVPT